MNLRHEIYDDVCVISISGDFINEETAKAVELTNRIIDEKNLVDFIIDLEECSAIDSVGLEALLAIRSKAEELFGQVKLCRLDETCAKILEITRLDTLFERAHDLPSALKMMVH
ncbi:MAG: STAS domain-containing protein [Phycisphaerae bacterium]